MIEMHAQIIYTFICIAKLNFQQFWNINVFLQK